MTAAAVERVRAFAQEATVGRAQSHGFDHLQEVAALADAICDELPEANRQLALICALLHDVPDHKYDRDGALLAKMVAFLEADVDLCAHAADIAWVVDNVSYSKEVKDPARLSVHAGDAVGLVRDIVSDADKIVALGRKGVERCREYAVELKPAASEADVDRHVVKHAHEKLLRLLPLFIRTAPGKRLAAPEHAFIAEYVAGLERKQA
jgi:HD superfamily phosphodiesterase